ncbi:unnamed protein product [Miscanthus lutarioriparius]|uniref:Uncharacterized protein n=1 Tax=Miscanthus lutarioriparius TaxID=422564 RepID=A0A811Q2M8_9POAL|nr:unnamed protein product [Miscanthus lutarioriparius]
MSLEESFKKSAAKCRKEYDIIYEQLPVLLEKMDILFPTGKKTESSEPENKSETKKFVAPLPAVTPVEIGEGYKDLEESIKGFIKDLDDAEKETGGTRQAATPPSSVEDE